MTRALGALWHVAFPHLMGHPTKPTLAALARTARRAWGERSVLMSTVRMLMMSPLDIIRQNFESDELRTALGCFAASNCAPLDFPGTGVILAAMALQHRYGVYRPVGGGGQFPLALAKLIRARGGEVLTGTAVQSVVVEQGRARGVLLADGRQFFSTTVIAAVSPLLLVNELLRQQNVFNSIRDDVAAISVCASNINSMTGVAYAQRPLLRGDAAATAALLGSSILVADDLASICAWITDAEAGRLGSKPPGWFITPSVQDRTLVPEGNLGDAMYVYLPAVPNTLAAGASWSEQKSAVFGAAVDMLYAKVPGLAPGEISRFTVSPDELAQFSHHCRHPFHVDMSLAQMGPWRPTRSLAGYRTPIKRLYHAGAGAHPMGTVNGWSGRTVARMILAEG